MEARPANALVTSSGEAILILDHDSQRFSGFAH